MCGRPLVDYAIQNALASELIDDVVVSSDSTEVLDYARQFDGISVVDRSSKLAQDAVTLDPVIFDAVTQVEREKAIRYDVVVTLQATSPLLTVATLDSALESFMHSDATSMISVVNAPHLGWKKAADGTIEPSYEKRLNRQQLPPNYLETGAFLISRRAAVTEGSRLGGSVSVFEVSADESIDIDNRTDWVACESLLSKKRIAFIVGGSPDGELGRVRRDLALAYKFVEHDVIFLCDARFRKGIDLLREANVSVAVFDGEHALEESLSRQQPDILVNDTLDTSTVYIDDLKKHASRVVTFDDLGAGAIHADAVINSVYDDKTKDAHVYSGKDYVCLRDEFLTTHPAAFSDQVHRVLVMFCGADQLDMASRFYRLARVRNAQSTPLEFDFVLSPDYTGTLPACSDDQSIRIIREDTCVASLMKDADLAISSQGRGAFELACLGVPTIILAQNEREQLFSFAHMDNGFINLGLGSEVSDEDAASAFEWLVGAESMRREMHRLMLVNDLKSGIMRTKHIVLGE
jgi:CMP-N-acetylneuraminic acid synthetase/spore coat polysaccharide biosynthesis predicted glycosyltransferase SpsG